MSFFAVIDSTAGSAAARPVLRWGEALDAAGVADQALNAGEVALTLSNLTAFEGAGLDDAVTHGHYWTINTGTLAIATATPSDDTTLLDARARQIIQRLLDESDQYITGERLISPARILLWLIYRNDLRNVPSQVGFPVTYTLPTKPSLVDNDTEALLLLNYHRRNVLDVCSFGVGGNPTGGLLQRGSNANGEFIRYADGTQICWHTLPVGAPNTAAGSIFVTPDATWTYPAAFAAAPSVGGIGLSTNLWLARGSGAVGATTAVLLCMRHATSGTSMFASVIATGRFA